MVELTQSECYCPRPCILLVEVFLSQQSDQLRLATICRKKSHWSVFTHFDTIILYSCIIRQSLNGKNIYWNMKQPAYFVISPLLWSRASGDRSGMTITIRCVSLIRLIWTLAKEVLSFTANGLPATTSNMYFSGAELLKALVEYRSPLGLTANGISLGGKLFLRLKSMSALSPSSGSVAYKV